MQSALVAEVAEVQSASARLAGGLQEQSAVGAPGPAAGWGCKFEHQVNKIENPFCAMLSYVNVYADFESDIRLCPNL